MSGNLKIRFAADMPVASVEVMSPDYQTVARLMVEPGREANVHVPSEGSFLRIHLPSGKIVTLTDERGQLDRFVSQAALDTAEGIVRSPRTIRPLPQTKTLRRLREYHNERADFREAAPPDDVEAGETVKLAPDMMARVFDPGNGLIKGRVNSDGDEATWQLGFGNVAVPPARLEIEHPGGRFYAILPANTQSVYARADQIKEGESLLIAVRLATRQPVADTILSYLERGDVYAAEAMVRWVEEAHDLLESKKSDPYAAAVGAYLLLRLRRFDLLRDWARNLANWFDFLPDGCVIWAWQQIYENPSNEGEIRRYLLKAASRGESDATRGLPIYSQGLRLLLDGLSLLPDDLEAREAAARLRRTSGAILWDSPVTAGSKLHRSSFTRSSPIIYDVSFMTPA
ncbi:MAG: hypothetical protein WAO00_10840 [Chthoniobacterales bacterium]